MTTSDLDVTFPVDNTRVQKSTWRAQNVIIRDELNVLFKRIGEAGILAFESTLSAIQIDARIRKQFSKRSYARDLAFTWTNL